MNNAFNVQVMLTSKQAEMVCAALIGEARQVDALREAHHATSRNPASGTTHHAWREGAKALRELAKRFEPPGP